MSTQFLSVCGFWNWPEIKRKDIFLARLSFNQKSILQVFQTPSKCFFKGKSPEVLFHGITSPYSYFEMILNFAPIHQEAKHDQENYQLTWTEKFFDKAQQVFAFLHIKPKFKVTSTILQMHKDNIFQQKCPFQIYFFQME